MSQSLIPTPPRRMQLQAASSADESGVDDGYICNCLQPPLPPAQLKAELIFAAEEKNPQPIVIQTFSQSMTLLHQRAHTHASSAGGRGRQSIRSFTLTQLHSIARASTH